MDIFDDRLCSRLGVAYSRHSSFVACLASSLCSSSLIVPDICSACYVVIINSILIWMVRVLLHLFLTVLQSYSWTAVPCVVSDWLPASASSMVHRWYTSLSFLGIGPWHPLTAVQHAYLLICCSRTCSKHWTFTFTIFSTVCRIFLIIFLNCMQRRLLQLKFS